MLEDNTRVAVKRSHANNELDEFDNAAKFLSEITHKNIIKLVGCFLEANHTPILVYEYATKGSLSDIFHGKKDLPLELRVNKIAIKTAEALAHLHTLETGVMLIQHGSVQLSHILLDDNFVPKVLGFYFSKRLTEDKDHTGTSTGHMQHISRKETINSEYYHLVPDFMNNSGKTFFDKDTMAQENMLVLEQMGRLALKCTRLEVDERPTMEQVVERLWVIRRDWKKRMAKRGI